MKLGKIIGIVLVVVGLVSLLAGGITWTKKKTVLDIGPLQAQTSERQTIPLPPIIGGVALIAGALLLIKR